MNANGTIFDDATIEARQARVAEALQPFDASFVVHAGRPISVPGGLDQTYKFVPAPLYYWLTGSRRAGGAIAFTPDEGWQHFVEPISASERLWEGGGVAPKGRDLKALDVWMRIAAKGPGELLQLGEGDANTPAPQAETLMQVLDAERRIKDPAEIALLRECAAATAAGHAKAREFMREGVSERRIQVELEAEMFRHGADGTGYGTIVGVGSNAAILHFSPSDRKVRPRDWALIDSGAAKHGYTADVTRTIGAGPLTSQQQAIYDIVLGAKQASEERCTAGTEWHDVHRAAAVHIAEGLVTLGILRGDPVALAEDGVVALFFPHGIGHLLGLGVRDVGGHAPDRPEGRLCCGARVRVDLPLQAGFVVTVEPGLYFVDALLDDPARRTRFADRVVWSEVEKWRGLGGVRLEDNLHIQPSGPVDNLTEDIPL